MWQLICLSCLPDEYNLHLLRAQFEEVPQIDRINKVKILNHDYKGRSIISWEIQIITVC